MQEQEFEEQEQEFEYLVIEADWLATNKPEVITKKLNVYAAQGWRLVTISYDRIIFERTNPDYIAQINRIMNMSSEKELRNE